MAKRSIDQILDGGAIAMSEGCPELHDVWRMADALREAREELKRAQDGTPIGVGARALLKKWGEEQ